MYCFKVTRIIIPSMVLTSYAKIYEILFESTWNSSNDVIYIKDGILLYC